MINASIMESSDVVGLTARYDGPANPVGNWQGPTRETAPLDKNADPRVKHPKLNRDTWTSSYAVLRSEAKPRRGTKRKRYNVGE